MGKVLKADGSADAAYAEIDLGSDNSEVWVTLKLGFDTDPLAYFTTTGSQNFCDLFDNTFLPDFTGFINGVFLVSPDEWTETLGGASGNVAPVQGWQTCELHFNSGDVFEFYIAGSLVFTDAIAAGAIRHVLLGLDFGAGDPDAILYFDDVKVGTTRGDSDLFSDTLESGDLDAWTSTFGAVSVVDDPFFTGLETPTGICWSPTATTLDPTPGWVRLDSDTDGYRLADGFTIQRGRQDVNDKTATGVATVTFRDTEGLLDPTNALGPWAGQLDPMKQAAIAMKNPMTDEWFTIFRGFVAGPNHELDMFTTARGFDRVSWQLVDAFDLFANVILTHGVHGDTPGLARFPNIYYHGIPANLPGEADAFCHVDNRIVQLLDDAGWPGTGNAIDIDNLRNIFSGNVSVQGTVYARKDSLLSALFDAADAEFPGIANIFVSKDGVVTFHGRYARFFPDRPGYGINHWYVGTREQAEIDPTIVPFQGPLQFYRSKDDVINASFALPQGVDETDAGVVHASDATSQSTFGYRSENFEGLIVSAGHNDDLTSTTAVEEANKFSAYIVGNYKDPKTRVGTLKFRSRSPGTIGATALWDLMTRVEIGDVVTLTTPHAGGGGFDDDFYVEQIRYNAEPIAGDYWDVVLELEVSPATYFGYNPFGEVDEGVS